jgi:hypothetical protein
MSADVKRFTCACRDWGYCSGNAIQSKEDQMSDRHNSLALERGTTSNRQIGDTTHWDGAPTSEQLSAGPHLTLVQAAAPAGTVPATESSSGPAATRKSHLERLVDALHRSRRIQATRVTRQYMHLVHQERS